MNEDLPIFAKDNLATETPFSPSDYVQWSKRVNGYDDVRVPECCLLAFDREILEEFSATHSVAKSQSWIGFHSTLYIGTTAFGDEIAVVPGTVGSPFASMTMEELICCGARHFLSIGTAGLIDTSLATPCLVLPTCAVRDEGTSYHYLAPNRLVEVNQDSLRTLLEACRKHHVQPSMGATWTTDAIYRETAPMIRQYRREGVLTVEMEVAALCAVSSYRKVSYAAMLYVSDVVHEEGSRFVGDDRRALIRPTLILEIVLDYFRTVRGDRAYPSH